MLAMPTFARPAAPSRGRVTGVGDLASGTAAWFSDFPVARPMSQALCQTLHLRYCV